MSTQTYGFIGKSLLRYFSPYLLCSIGFLSAEKFYHKPLQSHESGKDILISITTMEYYPSVEATIYYRSEGMDHYLEIPMDYSNMEWSGIISGDQVVSPFIEYLIHLEKDGVEFYAFPNESPFDNPYKIMLMPKDSKREFHSRKNRMQGRDNVINIDMLVLSPEDGEILEKDQIVIAVSFFTITDIDYESIRVLIDNNDVTEQAEIGNGLLTLVPNNLKSGEHVVRVSASNIHGLEIIPKEWSFSVAKHGINLAEKLVYDGSLSSFISKERVDNDFLNFSEFRGKLNAGLNWINTESNLRLTSRENPYSQSLNRISSTIKMGDYLTIYTGDFYPNLSPYLIAGKRVRGLGVSVAFSWINIDIISGDLNRTVQWRGKTDQGYVLNSQLTEVNAGGGHTYFLDRNGYTFSRSIDTYRLSMNYMSNYFLGVYFLKSKDDPISVVQNISSSAAFTVDSLAYGLNPGIYTLDEFQTAVEESNGTIQFAESKWGGGDPEDNLVIGFDTKAYFDQRQFSAEFSWNLSLYNRNIWDGAITLTELDTTLDDSLDGLIGTQYDENGLITGTPLMIDTTKLFNPDDYSRIFTINQYMTPLFFYDILSYEDNPIATIVNMPSSAFHLRLNGRYPNNNFYFEYRQVGPYYTTFGNPYLTNNIREFSINDQLALLDYKLIINFGYQYQDNDIIKTEVSPVRSHIVSSNIMLIPGPNVPSFTFNLQSINRTKEHKKYNEFLDLRENSVTANTSFSVNFPFEIDKKKNNLVINFNVVSNSDRLADERLDSYIFPKSDTRIIAVNLLNTILPNLRTKCMVYFAEITPHGQLNYISSKMKRSSYGLETHYSMRNNTIRMMGHLSMIKSSGLSTLNLFNGKFGCEMDVWKDVIIRLSGNLQLYENETLNDEEQTSEEMEQTQNTSFEINTSGLQLSIQYKF